MANMRISGLASGMDIDSIVSDMMKIKKMPLDKLKQEKQVMEWQRDDYREMNTLLLNFRSELTQMKLTTKYRTRATTTTDDSKVTATASSAASLSSFSISDVSRLASAETLVNRDSIYTDRTFDSSKSMNEQLEKLGQQGFEWESGAILSASFNVQKNDKEVTLKDVDIFDNTSISVKVNGIGFKVVTNKKVDELGDNEVLLDQTETITKLKFKDEFNIDSTVKVDYIAEYREDTISIPSNSAVLKLGKGAIDSIKDDEIVLRATTEGSTEPSDKKLTIIGDNIIDESETVIGSINRITGEINLNGNLIMPEKDSKTTLSLVVTYNHQYTSFSMDTNTSKDSRQDTFLVSASDSLNSVINQVNGASVGVNMFYDSATGQMTMTRNETGDFNNDPNKNDTTFLGSFIEDFLKFDRDAPAKVKGQNALFTINGLETNRTSNTFDINGVTFTLKKTFNEREITNEITGVYKNSQRDPNVSLAINNDSTAVYENIKKFIDSYNELISKIQGEVQEERFRGYAPLSDEQRESLSDKQQEQWEEKAKSGLLRRDSTLSSLLSSMRMDFYGTVESDNINPIYNQLAKIGIKTTANYLEGGKLEINEAQLKKAIEADPESVERLFNASGTTNGQKGIAQRLYDTVGKTMDILTEKAGKSYSTKSQFTIGRQLESLEDQIDRFEDRMIQLEDRYYRQFTAMEKMIQQANQQSAYIMNNFFA